MRPKARRRGKSRGRGLPVTVRTAKRTFATQESACVVYSGVGSQTTWEQADEYWEF
jgi:hypothetical protein